jgi:hypothetical protein
MVKYSCDYQKQDPLSGRKPGGCLFIFNAKRNFLMQLCIEKFPFYAIFHENIQIQRGLVFFCYIGILFAYIKVLTGALFTYHLLTTEARLHHISLLLPFFYPSSPVLPFFIAHTPSKPIPIIQPRLLHSISGSQQLYKSILTFQLLCSERKICPYCS